jgi:NhaA family Na+:H+ antiporter
VLGKAIGVSLFSYVSVKLKLAFLPENMKFKQLIGVAILSGVGFTMSLFIAGLAFGDIPDYLNTAKVGIIIASFVAGLIGYLIIRMSLAKK